MGAAVRRVASVPSGTGSVSGQRMRLSRRLRTAAARRSLARKAIGSQWLRILRGERRDRGGSSSGRRAGAAERSAPPSSRRRQFSQKGCRGEAGLGAVVFL